MNAGLRGSPRMGSDISGRTFSRSTSNSGVNFGASFRFLLTVLASADGAMSINGSSLDSLRT